MICSTTENRSNSSASWLASTVCRITHVRSETDPTVQADLNSIANRGPLKGGQTLDTRLLEFMRHRRGGLEPDSGAHGRECSVTQPQVIAAALSTLARWALRAKV